MITSLQARPESIDIDLHRSALLVVDMQNAFAKAGGLLDLAGANISGADWVIEVNQRLVSAARNAGVTIVFLAMTYKPDLSDVGGLSSPNYHKELGLKLMRKHPSLRENYLSMVPGIGRSLMN